VIEKEPLLFKLIQAHLRGYEILLLSEAGIPSYMNAETALNNLLLEAQFYCLEKLVNNITNFQAERAKEVPRSKQRTYELHCLVRTSLYATYLLS